MHNHPSGDVTPSEADRLLTRRVREASALMGIRLIDHLVMAQPSRVAATCRQFFSFREAGLI
jgi:DNA repair protein RadC